MRCKFKLLEKKETENGTALLFNVTNDKDNEDYFKFTPWGNINIGLVNKETTTNFIPGKNYYVDFIDADN